MAAKILLLKLFSCFYGDPKLLLKPGRAMCIFLWDLYGRPKMLERDISSWSARRGNGCCLRHAVPGDLFLFVSQSTLLHPPSAAFRAQKQAEEKSSRFLHGT